MNIIKKIIRKIIYKENATSDDLVNYLRSKGAVIGQRVKFYAPNKTLIDKTAPFLLQIGDDVRITEGVKILTHDYSWSVLKKFSCDTISKGRILGSQAPVEIGNNVFIGMNTIITKGVTIGDNVIIGVSSVVTKDLASNGVYAGNPARLIMSLEDFYRKRELLQFEEAKKLAKAYYKSFGVKPNKEVFSEYFGLFESGDSAARNKVFLSQMQTYDNFEDTKNYMNKNAPMFESFDAFLYECFKEDEADV